VAHHRCALGREHLRGPWEALEVASLRYLDTFGKIDGAWLVSERLLSVD
jgi:hypothetical protein